MHFKADLLCAAARSQHLCVCGGSKQVGPAMILSCTSGSLCQRSGTDSFGGSKGKDSILKCN